MRATCAVVSLVFAACLAAVAADDPASGVRLLLAEDRWEEAVGRARAAHAAAPDDPDVATALSEALFRAGRLEEAAGLVEGPASADAPPARALLLLAQLRSAAGRRAEAAPLIERAVELAPEDRDVLYRAGDLHGRRSRARELLEGYLALSEGDDPDRIEAARGALGFMEALGDRPVWVAAASPQRVEVPLIPIWDTTGRTHGYVVQVRLGEKRKPVRLLLDTGSSGLFLVERMARRRGFEPLAERTLFGGGGKGRHRSRRGLIPAFDLGGLRYTHALASTTPDEFDPTGRFHGLLGVSIFGGYRVTFDLERKRLILEADAEPLADGHPYWWISGQLLTRATAGEGDGLFVLDTGASDTVLADGLVNRLDRERPGVAVTVRSFGGEVPGARLVRGMTVRFRNLETDGPVLAYDLGLQSRLGGVELGGLLGLDLIGRRRLVLDTERQRLAILP